MFFKPKIILNIDDLFKTTVRNHTNQHLLFFINYLFAYKTIKLKELNSSVSLKLKTYRLSTMQLVVKL